jgi:zinc/manganese transport system permease protein
VQLAAAPRADQPLIDMLEYAVPSLRVAVFHARRAGRFVDASAHAERYRMRGER